MTYVEAIKFIKFYSKKIGVKLNNSITENDIYNDAFILNYENNKDFLINICNSIWNYKNIQISQSIKGRKVSFEYEKKCNHCFEYKNQAEFKTKFSNKYNFYYLNFICNDCEAKYQSEWHKKKYAEDVEYRNRIKESSKRNKIGKVLTKEQKLKAKEYSKIRWQNDAEFRQKQYAKKKEYYLKKKNL